MEGVCGDGRGGEGTEVQKWNREVNMSCAIENSTYEMNNSPIHSHLMYHLVTL